MPNKLVTTGKVGILYIGEKQCPTLFIDYTPVDLRNLKIGIDLRLYLDDLVFFSKAIDERPEVLVHKRKIGPQITQNFEQAGKNNLTAFPSFA